MVQLGRSARLTFAAQLLCLITMLVVYPALKAQSFYGSVVGTVTDPVGAVIPGAKVTVTNIATNESQTVQSDSGGKFSFVNLVPATYRTYVEKDGFKRFERDQLTVEVGAVVRVDSALQVGAISETVQVSTEAALLKTDSSTLSTEITGAEVQEMPLNGRNVLNLIALAPGVVPTGGALGSTGLNQGTRTAGGAGWGDYQIGGAIQGQSAQFIDGVANNLLGGNIVALVPTQDAIQEFSVASSNATADFGRFAGGVVNMATKTGGNAFHGSVWEYLRNRDFNANDYFSNLGGLARPKYNQNQYGASINGPIKRDRAFFMFTWEGFRALTGNLTPTSVPTQNLQNGIFPNAITDPLGICNISTTVNPGSWTITNLYGPSASTTYPTATCGDPTSKVMKTYYPLPNATGAANWLLTTPLANTQNQYNARIDSTLSSKQRIFGRYTYWTLADTGHSEFNQTGLGGAKWATDDGHVLTKTHQAVIGDTYSFNPTTVFDLRLNYVRQTVPNLAANSTVNPSQFGSNYAAIAPQFSLHTLPGLNASGIHSLYQLSNFPQETLTWYNTYGISPSLIKILGPHSLKFGAELRLMDASSLSYGSSAGGQFTYGTQFTGDEWASFLLGYPTTVQFKTASETAAYTYYQGYYISDTYQAARNLTLTLGLRYELPGAIAERKNRAVVLLPNATDPNTGIVGTESLVASSLYPGRTTVVPQYNLFAPRVGLSYRIEANTVVRGGYGISYLPNDLSTVTPFNAYVNGATTAVNIASSGMPCPLQSILGGLSNGTSCLANGQAIPNGLTQPLGRSNPAFMTLLGSKNKYLAQAITGPVPYQPYPYVQQWNIALSHQFKGNLAMEIAYSGLKGTNIPGVGNRGLDQLPDQYDSLGAALTATPVPCAAANNLVLSPGQCLRPYPYYNNVGDSAGFYARTNYRSIQAKLEKRMGAAGTLLANYTYSRTMGNTDTQSSYLESKSTTQGGNGAATVQDWTNLAGEYSLISYDVTNRAIIAYVLKVPVGHGQKFGNTLTGPINTVVSGWAVNGITTLQSGFPIFLQTASSNQLFSSFGAGITRPMVVPGCNKKIAGGGLSRVKAGAWFNTACFENVGATTLINGVQVANSVPFSTYQFGNEPRVDPDLRADGVKNFDFSLQKQTTIHESANLEFKAEFFNLFNRVQFAPPINTVGASNYGAVLYQVNHPRQIQLSLRLNY